MRFGSNPQINRLIFVLSSRLLPKHIDTGYFVNATPLAILRGSYETLLCFCKALKMCMRFGIVKHV